LKYLPQVTRECRYFINADADCSIYLAQIETESACKEGLTSFDGGKGLSQTTGSTIEWLQEQFKELQELSVEPDPYNPAWSIRSLVVYDNWLSKRTRCKGDYYTFRAYNGGVGLLNKECARAGTCSIALVEKQCRRNVVHLKSGKLLDLCVVNERYPNTIKKLALKYVR